MDGIFCHFLTLLLTEQTQKEVKVNMAAKEILNQCQLTPQGTEQSIIVSRALGFQQNQSQTLERYKQ